MGDKQFSLYLLLALLKKNLIIIIVLEVVIKSLDYLTWGMPYQALLCIVGLINYQTHLLIRALLGRIS
jgi:hypothetical protein